jgi:uncharacterized protein YbjT (DUF2867 family)
MTKVLVTGATGNIGTHVAHELRTRGASVRAFVRDPDKAAARLGDGVELAVGDFTDPASLRRALAGVDRVFLTSADGPQKVEHETAVVDAAAAAWVQRVVKLSTIGAQTGSALPPFDWHGRIEEHLLASTLPAVILRSSSYMTNLLMSAEQVRQGKLFAAADDGKVPMIDPRDVGAAAAVVLTDDGHDGKTYALTGPEAITYHHIAEQLGAATGHNVEFVDVPDGAFREGLVAAGMPDWLVAHLDGLFGMIRRGAFEQTTDTVRALTGRTPRSFAEFARDHAAAFGG